MDKNNVGSASREVRSVRALDQQLPKERPERARPSEPDPELFRALEDLKQAAKKQLLDLDMKYDEDLDVVVVTVKEHGTKRVLRQIPPDELLRLAKLLRAGRHQLMDRLI